MALALTFPLPSVQFVLPEGQRHDARVWRRRAVKKEPLWVEQCEMQILTGVLEGIVGVLGTIGVSAVYEILHHQRHRRWNPQLRQGRRGVPGAPFLLPRCIGVRTPSRKEALGARRRGGAGGKEPAQQPAQGAAARVLLAPAERDRETRRRVLPSWRRTAQLRLQVPPRDGGAANRAVDVRAQESRLRDVHGEPRRPQHVHADDVAAAGGRRARRAPGHAHREVARVGGVDRGRRAGRRAGVRARVLEQRRQAVGDGGLAEQRQGRGEGFRLFVRDPLWEGNDDGVARVVVRLVGVVHAWMGLMGVLNHGEGIRVQKREWFDGG